MTDLSGLHAQATRLKLVIREGLERLEAAENGLRPGDPATIARDLQGKLGELQRTSRELESIWRMQVVRQGTAKRDVWKAKVEQTSEETESLRRELQRYGGREQRRQQEQEDREELLARAEAGRKIKDEMEEEAAITGHVTRSKQMLAGMFDQGTAILAGMSGNRQRIKDAQRKALDIINSVGMGESVLKMIEKRQRGDVYLVLGGMGILVLVTIGLIWWAWL